MQWTWFFFLSGIHSSSDLPLGKPTLSPLVTSEASPIQKPHRPCDYLGVSMVTSWGFQGGSVGKESAAVQEMEADVRLIPGSGRSSEKGMATHSSILAWRIPQTDHRVAKSCTWLKELSMYRYTVTRHDPIDRTAESALWLPGSSIYFPLDLKHGEHELGPLRCHLLRQYRGKKSQKRVGSWVLVRDLVPLRSHLMPVDICIIQVNTLPFYLSQFE